MTLTTIKNLDDLESLAKSPQLPTLAVLSIAIPYDEDLLRLETESFWSMYRESPGDPALARRAFDSHVKAREAWLSRFRASVERVLEGAKQSLRFFEYILPDCPVPINILPTSSTMIFPNLTTVSVQWLVHRRSMILERIPEPLWLDTEFAESLKSLLLSNSATINTLRLSLPSCEFSQSFIDECLGDPHTLPSLRVLDATHTAIGYSSLVKNILPAHPTLEHLILDDGAQYAPGGVDIGGYSYEEDEDDDQVAEEAAAEAAPLSRLDELGWTWMGVGYALENEKPRTALKSICAAFQVFDMGQLTLPLEPEGIRGAIKRGVLSARNVDPESTEDDGLDLVICGAWPSEGKSEETEAVRGHDREKEPHAFTHTPGCAHLEAYAEGPRPANIWRSKDWMPGTVL